MTLPLGLDGVPMAVRLARATQIQRFTLTNEKTTQQEMFGFLLRMAGEPVVHEYKLSRADIPDFFLPLSGLAIEVKLKAHNSKMRVYRQLERYAQHECVKAILLMTNLAMTLPAEINGRPAFVCPLGVGWL